MSRVEKRERKKIRNEYNNIIIVNCIILYKSISYNISRFFRNLHRSERNGIYIIIKMYYKYLRDFADITATVTLEGENRFSWTIAAVV